MSSALSRRLWPRVIQDGGFRCGIQVVAMSDKNGLHQRDCVPCLFVDPGFCLQTAPTMMPQSILRQTLHSMLLQHNKQGQILVFPAWPSE